MTTRPEDAPRDGRYQVSIIVPMLNEADHVERLVADVAGQDYADIHELLIADGGSDDGSVEILEHAAAEHDVRLTVIHNPARWVSHGLNACIARSSGDVIVRMDCHARYSRDYVSRCVAALQETGAWNVGGTLTAVGRTPTERAVACAMETPFGGIGWTRHSSRPERVEVDTVTFGAFPRDVFERVGGFDEGLVRNQDNDLNARLRLAGGKVVLDPAINVEYVPRGTYRRLFRQYYEYGLWKGRVSAKHGRVLNVRSVVPLSFVASVAALASLAPSSPSARRLLRYELGTYGLSCVAFAVLGVVRRQEDPALIPRVAVAFPVFHVAHGLGMARALLDQVRR
jgi:glycosyltransferase involved in cell wall biosynthesis